MKPEPIYKEIGAIVRKLRRRDDTAQEKLAGRLGISRATLASIETGRQRILVHQLYAIARELRVQVTDLLPTHPSKQDGAAVEDLNFTEDLNAKQKKQLADLIGSVPSTQNDRRGR